MKKYTSLVKLEFGGNEFHAKSKEEYIKKVILSFKQEFDIELNESEIQDIEVIE